MHGKQRIWKAKTEIKNCLEKVDVKRVQKLAEGT